VLLVREKKCPTHPAALLKDDVLPVLRLPVAEAALQLSVSRQTLYKYIAGTSPVAPEMAVWLGKWCGNGPGLWLRMQQAFDLWNTIIGEGDAEEHANDALFTIDIRSDGEQNIAQPLTMTVTDKRGKILASRTTRNILTGEKGNATAALWVRDVGCAGSVTFTAAMGASTRSSDLDFNCGE
jgi:antitoxin HigA-1